MSGNISLSGNEAAARAMRQINPDVVAAFPITPSTEVSQYYSQFIKKGEVDTELVLVESEHSAMSACIGASAAGARVMTASSSNGIALMFEPLYIAASMRLPIVMAAVNRTLSAPISIHNDHSDTMGLASSGWIQIYCSNVQEVYDTMLQAIRIAEHPDVSLPVMVCYDGFITSHAVENFIIESDELARSFVGRRKPAYSLLSDPVSFGALDMQPYYFEHKRNQAEGMYRAKQVICEVADEYASLVGRKQNPLFECYRMEDAEYAAVLMSSSAETCKDTVDSMRERGVKAGLVKLRSFRPFPGEELAKLLEGLRSVALLDKVDCFNAGAGPIANETRAAMYQAGMSIPALAYIYGLGGRDVTPNVLEQVYEDQMKAAAGERFPNVTYLGVRSEEVR